MFPPKKILFPVDFSERCASAGRMAEVFSGRFQAELTLLHVLQPLTYNDIPVDSASVAEERLGSFMADELRHFDVRRVLLEGEQNSAELSPSLFGTQAQRRRWLKRNLYVVPGSPVLLFFYRYLFRSGFLDGIPGLIYCGFQAVQMFHTKAKIYELRAEGRTKSLPRT